MKLYHSLKDSYARIYIYFYIDRLADSLPLTGYIVDSRRELS
jgi:hypothetical protein